MHLKHLLMLMLAAFTSIAAHAQHRVAPANAPLRAPGDVTIYASLIYDDSWDPTWAASDDKAYGVCAMTPTAASFTNVSGVSASLNAIGGGFYRNGHYYCLSYWTATGYYYVTTLNEWDVNTWQLLRSTRTEVSEAASDMTYDAVTDAVYGCFMKDDNSGYDWGTFNIETAKRTVISTLPERLAAIAADGKGNIFAIGARGTLYSVEPTTGKLTALGKTGHTAYHLGSGVIDERTGDLYWFCYPSDTESYLFRVNTTTAECTLVYRLPKNEEFVGAFILPPAAEGSAPDEVTNLAAHFDGEALSGTLTFNLPTTDYDGNALTGSLTYYVELDGTQVATGDGTPGEQITVNYTAAEGQREYKFSVYASNGANGAKASCIVWIGGDAPTAISNLSVSRNATSSSTLHISWDAPAGTQHGGNLLGFTYDIVRLPDNAKVATGITATEWTDNIAETGQAVKYAYIITPYNGTYAGPATTSAATSVGSAALPFTSGFDSEDDFSVFTVVDANADGMTWGWHKLASGSQEATATCNTPEYKPQDDWLITPGLRLKPGTLYRLSFYPTCRYSFYPQKVSAALGRGTTAADMTRLLVPVTKITADLYDSPKKQQIVQTFTVDKEDVYYIGLHAVSDPDSYYLHIDNLVVEEASSVEVPAAVTHLTVTPDAQAALRATITFTAPTTSVVGGALSSLSHIDIIRGEEIVHTFTSPAQGSTLSWTDEAAEEGFNTYSVVCHNTMGNSEAVAVTQWIGFDTPEAPAQATVRRENGQAVITWEAPTQGVHGGVVVPERLTYDVLWSKGLTPVVTDLTTLSATDQPTLEAQQELIQYYVCAKTPNGMKSAYAYTNKTIYGEPYTMPIEESFAGSATTISPWFATCLKGDGWYTTWNLTSRGLAPYTTPYDSDGGLATCAMSEVGDRVRYATPLLTLQGSTRPLLEFWYYWDQGSKDRLSVEVSANGGDYTTLHTIDFATAPAGENGWRKVTVDLNAYTTAEFIQIGFTGERADATMHHIHIDNIRVREQWTHDVAVVAIHAPRALQVGKENTVSVTVGNLGTQSALGTRIELHMDGTSVGTRTIESIAAGAEDNISFTVVPAASAGSTTELYAEAFLSSDADPSNNVSETITVRNQQSLLPGVEALGYTLNEQDFKMTWREPDTEGRNGTLVLEDFEAYEPFIIDHVGPWTLYDGTRAYTYGVGGVTYPYAYGPAAYQVFNPSQIGVVAEYWKPFSGEQILASFDAATYDPTDLTATVPPTDHWLISPLLPGCQQRVTFQGRSVTTTYGLETFQILYTTKADATPADFQPLVGAPFEAPAEWTEISFTLPEGARHFAIRHNSQNIYALLIDDITYRSAVAVPQALTLVGYNVYRDGQLITAEPLAESEYAATLQADDLDHNYNVTAVYAEGESAFSQTVNPTVPMGIKALTALDSQRTTTYDLQGRAYAGQPQKGVFIQTGRDATTKLLAR